MIPLHSVPKAGPSPADTTFERIKAMRQEQQGLSGDAYFASVDAELVEVGRLRELAEVEGRTGDFFITTETPEPGFVRRAINAAKTLVS